MEKYIEDRLKELCDEKSKYFSKIIKIINNPNPKNYEYAEVHHIIPRSIDDKLIKDKNNLISLSAYNHIMIHYYYYKCAKSESLITKCKAMFFFVGWGLPSEQRLNNLSEKEAKKVAKLLEKEKMNTCKKFICLETNKIYGNLTYCSKELKLNNLHLALTGKIGCCGGYHFIYCDDERLKTMSNEEIINEIDSTIKLRRKEKRKHMFTDEWRNKISKAHSGKEFICLETNEIFTNQTECCNKYNICKSELCNMLNKHQYHRTDKLHFVYTDEKGNKSNEDCLNEINEHVLETNGNLNRYNAKQVICYETNVIYKSTSEAVRQTKIQGIANACLHNTSCAGGYHWFFIDENIDREKYVKEHPIVYINNKVVCLETRKIYNSVEEVSKEFNVSKGAIISVCNHKTIKCAKHHFLYEREYLTKTENEIQTILNKNSKDTQKEIKALYNKMVSDGTWDKENNGWNRFQKYYKENIA